MRALVARSACAALVLAAVFSTPAYAIPKSVDTTPFTVEGLCAFPVQFQLSGKTNMPQLPGGRFIVTSPGETATLTNVSSPAHQVTLNITGSFVQTTNADGSVVTFSHGRNLLFDPVAGFVLAVGDFSFVFDAAGNLVQPLSGNGTLTNVCGLLGG
jgi:hypothetical protein